MIDNYIFNTGESNKELREKYNPENSTLRKAQLRMLDMLLYIDNICREQNIKYSLDGGNVLGAIRHNGFIPWDDDIDIILEKKEYNKLCHYLQKHPHPQYVLQTPKTDPMFINHWNVLRDTKSEYIQNSPIHNARKYRGLQIDIFPIENYIIPPFYRFIIRYHGKCQRNLIKHTKLSKFFFNVNRFFIIPTIRFISRIIGKKDLFTYAYGLYWGKWRYPQNILFPYKEINFEGHLFYAPANPNEFLKIHYGENYMDLPPIDKRDHHHAKYKIYD